MEYAISIGYDDGKSLQGTQIDTPTLTVAQTNSKTIDIAVLNVIQGERAESLFRELTNLTNTI
jgi:hypothetical protein